MRKLDSRSVLVTAALVAAVFFALPASAQGRLSLSERLARLEQQVQGQGSGQSTVELLNRIDELQGEVQALRGLVEQQAFEIEGLKKRARDQYVDLDARITRLEGGTVSAPGAASATADPRLDPATTSAPAQPTEPGQLAMEEPELGATTEVPAEPVGTESAPPTAAPGDDPAAAALDEKSAYDDAFAALRDGRYAESARRFAAFLERYPNGEYADNATYWLGESYYVTQNYQIALDTFSDLLGRFPNSSKAPDALLKVGYCHYELKDWAKARAALNDVVSRYPDTTVARLAQGRLRALLLEGQR